MDAKDFKIIDSRAIYMAGKYVAVVLPVIKKDFRKVIDDIEYKGSAKIADLSGKPYIDFIDLRHDDRDDEWYIDDDSPVAGGLDIGFSDQIANEIRAAIAYIRGKE